MSCKIDHLNELEFQLQNKTNELQVVHDSLNLTLKAKDAAYAERNKLVALLSSIYPACLIGHPDDDVQWESDWRNIVVINLPTGQATWHIHDSELPMFDHLKHKIDVKWDGHATEEKYARVERCKNANVLFVQAEACPLCSDFDAIR